MKQILKVDFDKVICKEFLGMNAVYHGFAFMQEAILRGENEEDFKKELRAAKEANVKIARTMFAPFMNCRTIEGPYDMKCRRMDAMRRWCSELKKEKIDVAMQAGWHFTENTFWGHEQINVEKDPYFFAEWVYQSMDYLINDCGLDNIKYLILFTEPTSHERRLLPDGYDSWNYYVPVVKAIDKRFRDGGLRGKLKFVGPNNTNYGRHLQNAVDELNDIIDIYSGHDYNFANHFEWRDMCRSFSGIVARSGKPFWLDEYGMQLEIFRGLPQYGTYLAQIVAASVAAGHQTSLIWTIFDQLHCNGKSACELEPCTEENTSHNYNIDSFHNGVHRWGLKYWEHDNVENPGGFYPAWYAYCLLANALGGEKVSSCFSEDAMTVYACAVKSGDDFSIVAINSNAVPADIMLDTNAAGIKTIYRYNFAPWSNDKFYETKNEPQLLTMSDGKLSDILPKGGFCVYRTIKL